VLLANAELWRFNCFHDGIEKRGYFGQLRSRFAIRPPVERAPMGSPQVYASTGGYMNMISWITPILVPNVPTLFRRTKENDSRQSGLMVPYICRNGDQLVLFVCNWNLVQC
jgi:hypothetical protein